MILRQRKYRQPVKNQGEDVRDARFRSALRSQATHKCINQKKDTRLSNAEIKDEKIFVRMQEPIQKAKPISLL